MASYMIYESSHALSTQFLAYLPHILDGGAAQLQPVAEYNQFSSALFEVEVSTDKELSFISGAFYSKDQLMMLSLERNQPWLHNAPEDTFADTFTDFSFGPTRLEVYPGSKIGLNGLWDARPVT